MQRDFEVAINQLAEKHKRAMQGFEAWAETRETGLKRNLVVERNAIQTREKMLATQRPKPDDRHQHASSPGWVKAQFKQAVSISRDVRTSRCSSPLKTVVPTPPMPRLTATNTALGLPPFQAQLPPRKPQLPRELPTPRKTQTPRT
jgi:hypothetical protein